MCQIEQIPMHFPKTSYNKFSFLLFIKWWWKIPSISDCISFSNRSTLLSIFRCSTVQLQEVGLNRADLIWLKIFPKGINPGNPQSQNTEDATLFNVSVSVMITRDLREIRAVICHRLLDRSNYKSMPIRICFRITFRKLHILILNLSGTLRRVVLITSKTRKWFLVLDREFLS